MLYPSFGKELLHVEIGHKLTAFELVDARLDVAAEALQLDAVQFDAVTVGVKRLRDELVRSSIVTRRDRGLDKRIKLCGKLNSDLAHGRRVGASPFLVKEMGMARS